MHIEDYLLRYVARRDVSPGYVDQLAYCLRSLQSHHSQPVETSDLSEDVVNGHLKWMSQQGLSRAYRRGHRRSLLTLWLAAHEEVPSLASRPNIRLIMQIRPAATVIRGYSSVQAQTLLSACDGLSGTLNGSSISRRLYFRAYVMALWDTGLRGCDVRSLERSWIQATGILQIVQHKTGKAIWCRLRESTLEAIDETFPPDRRLIWPLWCGMRHFREECRRLVRLAGLPGSFKWLRSGSGTAVEALAPGRGHEHLGNSRQVFERHYLCEAPDRPMPPELVCGKCD